MKGAKLAALAALIAAVPMILSVPEQAAPEPPSKPVTVSASPMLTALSQYLKLPVEQARARWRQERQAAQTDAQLRRQLGKTFMGSWLSGDGQLNVAISDPTKAAMVRVAGAHPKLISPTGMTLRDAVQLLATAKRPAGFVSWYPDPAANRVVVGVKPGTAATARTWLKKRLDATPFAVRTTTEVPRPSAQFIRGGAGIATPNNPAFRSKFNPCSVGFAVEGGFITAGHCGKVGDEVQTTEDPFGTPIGTFESSVYGPEGDFAFVKTLPSWTLMAEVFRFDGNKTMHVAGSAEAPIGATVCRSGQTTGWRCGKILAKNIGFEDPRGIPIGGLTKTDACMDAGDSGGPFIADGQAQGTVYGGRYGCNGDGESFFQPINEVLTKLNLKLLTKNQEPPFEPDPGFGPCC